MTLPEPGPSGSPLNPQLEPNLFQQEHGGQPLSHPVKFVNRAANAAPQKSTVLPPVAPLPPATNTAPTVVNTDNEKGDGLDKCPKCGSTEITYDVATGKLVCLFCRNSWNQVNAESTFDLNTPIAELRGDSITSGAQAIDRGANNMVTLKCQACGAEVVVNTENSTQSRCHWCRQVLSINNQIPNGAIPDAVLPFKLPKEEAIRRISEFAGSRKFFALSRFRKEFTPENVVGVYLPYMVIDGNLTAELHGKAEIQTRRWTETHGTGKNRHTETYYDADVYEIGRRFDYTVDDLQVESSQERLDMSDKRNTNNIINSILPFDVKNAAVYDSNYLSGYTSEKRDLDVEQLKPVVANQFLSIARYRATQDASQYRQRGIRWEQEGVAVKGSRWVSMYLPVWLYSYYEKEKDMLHYIAVNGRSGETMGSVPLNYPKLFLMALLAGIVAELPFGALLLSSMGGS